MIADMDIIKKILDIVDEVEAIPIAELAHKIGIDLWEVEFLVVNLHNENRLTLKRGIVRKIKPGKTNKPVGLKDKQKSSTYLDSLSAHSLVRDYRFYLVLAVLAILFIPPVGIFFYKGVDSSRSFLDIFSQPYDLGIHFWYESPTAINTRNSGVFTLDIIRDYNITGTIVGIEGYRDRTVPFSTHDIYLCWGEHRSGSMDVVLSKDRRASPLYSELSAKYIFPKYDICTHIHVIPADTVVSDMLFSLKKGQNISIDGRWVSVTRPGTVDPDGTPWIWGKDSMIGDYEPEVVKIEEIKKI